MDPSEEMPAEPVEDRLAARTRAAVLAAGKELLVERGVQGIAVEGITR
jgi:AcrR family transcriptional regulator